MESTLGENLRYLLVGTEFGRNSASSTVDESPSDYRLLTLSLITFTLAQLQALTLPIGSLPGT